MVKLLVGKILFHSSLYLSFSVSLSLSLSLSFSLKMFVDMVNQNVQFKKMNKGKQTNIVGPANYC